MIAVGLSWKLAIAACVIGNTIMGIIITTNGRLGATVGYVFQNTEPSLLRIASYPVSRSRAYAIWLLL
jgi:cytosine/uracil/thiamine/allantoin permease